jgi:hypothetical protein
MIDIIPLCGNMLLLLTVHRIGFATSANGASNRIVEMYILKPYWDSVLNDPSDRITISVNLGDTSLIMLSIL